MILVSVGSSEFPFDRLLKIIDELCEFKIIDGTEVIAQTGVSKYTPKNYKFFSIIDHMEYENYVNKADLIITHAGTGSVVPPLKLGKKIILFPRMSKYGEHIDDHQLDLCKVFVSKNYTLVATNKEELIDAIKKIDQFIPSKFISNTNCFLDKLVKYIDNL